MVLKLVLTADNCGKNRFMKSQSFPMLERDIMINLSRVELLNE